MKKKLIIALTIVIFFLFTLFKSGVLRVSIESRPVVINSTTLSLMIMRGIQDDEIIEKINQDKSLLFEFCTDCPKQLLSAKDPLLAAILSKRLELAKFMIINGAPFGRSIKILKQTENEIHDEFINVIIDLALEAEENKNVQPTL